MQQQQDQRPPHRQTPRRQATKPRCKHAAQRQDAAHRKAMAAEGGGTCAAQARTARSHTRVAGRRRRHKKGGRLQCGMRGEAQKRRAARQRGMA
ncbi:hypothetical protein AVEN_152527-1 [Araneus ventricosus]|uniref:Uncharacterized protein n=1 Tax=Araneus ventricosus TaxID=182803 RepID=A0A4Y2WQD9_ARAVE|nr:hypothetical protein AVEN_152527-1 [Araneus ventricosus]